MTWLNDVIAAVRHHMREDHAAETVAIARWRFPEAVSASVETLDELTLTLRVGFAEGSEQLVTLDWPVPVAERVDIRHQIVALYKESVPEADGPEH